jgi:invasion protein IalB
MSEQHFQQHLQRSSGRFDLGRTRSRREKKSMRVVSWIGIAACGVLVAIGAAVLLGALGSNKPEAATNGLARTDGVAKGIKNNSDAVRESQLRQAPAPAPAAPGRQAPAAAPAAPAAPSGPQRVETTVYDSWVVTCQDNTGGTTKRTCLASLRVTNQNRKVLLNWQIGSNQEGRYVAAIHVPSGLPVKKDNQIVGGAILIGNGVELKFGNAAARRLSYVSCNPQQCLAEAPIDDAFVREALANSKATITVYTPAGAVPYELEIKGIDKAIQSTRG